MNTNSHLRRSQASHGSVESLEPRRLLTGHFVGTGQILPHASGDVAEVGDFDSDGDQDILILNRADQKSNFTILTNDGHAAFEPVVSNIDVPMLLGTVRTGDINGDQHLDVVVSSNLGQSVWLGNGAFGFEQTDDIGNRNYRSIELADLDADGDLDAVASLHLGRWHNEIWANDGRGNFERRQTIIPDADAKPNRIADFDGDGDVDILFNNELWLNNGEKFIQNWQIQADQPLTGDFNGDGTLDLLVNGSEPGVWLSKNGRFRFELLPEVLADFDGLAKTKPLWDQISILPVTNIEIGDVDGDDDLDLIATFPGGCADCFIPGESTVLTNDGSGVFSRHSTFGFPRNVDLTRTADFDNDGDLDVFQSGLLNDYASEVFLNADVPTDVEVQIADGQQVVFPGEHVTYEVTIKNNGPVAVDTLSLSSEFPDDSFENVTWACATDACGRSLAVGESIAYEFAATIRSDATQTVVAQVKASVNGQSFDVNPSNSMGIDKNWVSATKLDTDRLSEANSDITLKFHSLDEPSLTPTSFVAFSETQGQIPASGQLTDKNEFTLRLESRLQAGERVQVSAIGDLKTENGQPIPKRVWDLRVASGGSGRFSRTPGLAGDRSVLAIGDVNSDGQLDALVKIGAKHSIWYGDDGVFSDSGQLVGETATDATFVDVDGDGDLDVFLTRLRSVEYLPTVGIVVLPERPTQLWRNEAGVFLEDATVFSVGKVQATDLDADGDQDIVIGAEVWRNVGMGEFESTEQILPAPLHFVTPVIGDLDGDGDMDALTSDGHAWLNNGEATFTDSGHRVAGDDKADDYSAAALGDVDQDGDLDVLVYSNPINGSGGALEPSYLSLWLNDGGGSFQVRHIQVFAHSNFPVLALRDLDGDGDLDAVTSLGSHGIYFNDGRGRFEQGFEGDAITSRPPVARNTLLGDIDNDGDVDIVAGNRLWLNTEHPTDLSIRVQNSVDGVPQRQRVPYIVEVSNASQFDAPAANASVTFSEQLLNVSWTCLASDGAACPTIVGQGDIENMVQLNAGEWLRYEVIATVTDDAIGAAQVEASIEFADGQKDADTSNNQAADRDYVRPWHATPLPHTHQNAVDVPLTIQLGSPIDVDSISAETIQITGNSRGVYRLGNVEQVGSELRIQPQPAFSAGERVNVTVTDNVRFADGTTIPNGFSWQFRTSTSPTDNAPATPVNEASKALAFGDADNDGDIDGWGRERLYLNDGNGSFFRGDKIWGGPELRGYVAAGDVDGDGDLDALVAKFTNQLVTETKIWINQGDASFEPRATTLPQGDNTIWRAEFADLDNDGDVDLVTDTEADGVQIWNNDGSGNFQNAFNQPFEDDNFGGSVGIRRYSIEDLDVDGRLDLIVREATSNVLYTNKGGLLFERIGTVPGIRLADLDQDGDLDFFGSGESHRNDAGQFVPTGTYNSPTDEIGDLDGDGVLDLIGRHVGPVNAGPLADLDGDGDIERLDHRSALIPITPVVIRGDTDGDGDVDFADFLILSSSFGKTVENTETFAPDIDQNGSVGFSDFLILSADFGLKGPPT